MQDYFPTPDYYLELLTEQDRANRDLILTDSVIIYRHQRDNVYPITEKFNVSTTIKEYKKKTLDNWYLFKE